MTAWARLIGCSSVALLLAGCSSSPATPKPFVLNGSVTLQTGAIAAPAEGCTGWSGMGFAQVTQGASVVVLDKSGVQVASGMLGPGLTTRTGYTVPCQFKFRVAGVPAGDGPYQVRIADQKGVTVSEADAMAGRFAQLLG